MADPIVQSYVDHYTRRMEEELRSGRLTVENLKTYVAENDPWDRRWSVSRGSETDMTIAIRSGLVKSAYRLLEKYDRNRLNNQAKPFGKARDMW